MFVVRKVLLVLNSGIGTTPENPDVVHRSYHSSGIKIQTQEPKIQYCCLIMNLPWRECFIEVRNFIIKQLECHSLDCPLISLQALCQYNIHFSREVQGLVTSTIAIYQPGMIYYDVYLSIKYRIFFLSFYIFYLILQPTSLEEFFWGRRDDVPLSCTQICARSASLKRKG